MNNHLISINLESVLDRMNGTYEIIHTLNELKDIGYRYIEILHSVNPDNGKTWAEILNKTGMKVSSIHELYEDIEKDPEKIADKAISVGCKYIVCGLSRFTTWEDEKSIFNLIEGLNKYGKYFSDRGLQLLYHNHNMEFTKVNNKTALDYIFENTDPNLVGAELDIYWVQLSGQSPEFWCDKLNGRLKTMHLKDLGVKGISTPTKYIKEPTVMPLGYGNINFSSIIKAADNAGCKWYIVETHTGWIDNDSLYTAKVDFEYLVNLL